MSNRLSAGNTAPDRRSAKAARGDIKNDFSLTVNPVKSAAAAGGFRFAPPAAEGRALRRNKANAIRDDIGQIA